MTITEALALLTAEMEEGGIPSPLSQRFTLAATAADLCRIAGEPVPARVLLAANNAYELSLFSVGVRERLDEGRLYLYRARGVLPRTWEDEPGERFTLDSPNERLEAAVDGEPVELEAPLELAIEPGALRVLLPRRQD